MSFLFKALLWVENPDTKKKIKVIPGVHRDGAVQVGRHIPPLPENIEFFLQRFNEAYDSGRLSKLQRIIAIAASHHRYVWIHPIAMVERWFPLLYPATK